MAGVPINFQALSNVLPTYNFVDIAAGTGYINFYAGDTVDLKILSNFTYYSDAFVSTSAGVTFSADNLMFDHDYDTLLNRPMDIRGLGIVNIPVGVSSLSGSSFSTVYAIVYVRKWDGVTETDIANNTSSTYRAAGTISYDTLSVDLNIPLTHFKVGEYLRLTIRLYCTADGDNPGVNRYVYYAHDPKGRTTGWDTSGAVPSTLMFQCPVRLNL